ncbi:hypothetical protein [Bdellovibrio sp. KM01]
MFCGRSQEGNTQSHYARTEKQASAGLRNTTV